MQDAFVSYRKRIGRWTMGIQRDDIAKRPMATNVIGSLKLDLKSWKKT